MADAASRGNRARAWPATCLCGAPVKAAFPENLHEHPGGGEVVGRAKVPRGTTENSPPIYRWEPGGETGQVPAGTKETWLCFFRRNQPRRRKHLARAKLLPLPAGEGGGGSNPNSEMEPPFLVAQVSEPAVSPTSQSAGPRRFGPAGIVPALAGWETRDTAGREARATSA